MVLLLAFLTCVCRLLLGWKGCSIRSMKQELFDIVFTSLVVFTISSCCNLCEWVCSCLLLMGWNGCRLVYLFAVAGVEGLSLLALCHQIFLSCTGGRSGSGSLRKVGLQCPPLPSLLSLLLLGICLSMCGWDGSVCFSATHSHSRAKYLQKITLFPFARCAFHQVSLFSM